MVNYAEILIIDDMPENIAYSDSILRSEDYRVFVATGFDAVRRFLERRKPDLILLDRQLDVKSSHNISQMLKNDPDTADIPVLVMLSDQSTEVISDSFDLGGRDYIKKPFIKEAYLVRVHTQLLLAAQRKQLVSANNELAQFCSAVSHDLKAPFNIINMLIDMLKSELGDDCGEGISTIMDMITVKATQTKTMIERLFEFSKMCNIVPKMKQVDVKAMAQGLFNDLAMLEKDRDIKFICGDIPSIKCDEVLMGIMLKNLLQNAIKYTSKNKTAVIEMSACQDAVHDIITIKDNGVGFNMDYVGKIFRVFERLHSEEEFEGNGVGLALVNRIMERHGGSVEAYGKVDEGAEFHLIFPKRH